MKRFWPFSGTFILVWGPGWANRVSVSVPPCIQVDAHGRQVKAAVPAFGRAVAAAFQVPVVLKLLVAPFRGGPCLIFFFPFPRVPWGYAEKPWIVGRGDMDHLSVVGAATLAAVRAFVDVGPCVRAAVLDPHTFFFGAVPNHFFAVHADGAGIHGTESDALFLECLHALEVQIDERSDAVLPAEKVSGEVVVGGVQEQPADLVFGKEGPHGHEGMDEADGVVHGGGVQEWEDRKVVARIGSGEEVKVVAIVKTIPGGIPTAVTIGLGIPFEAGTVIGVPASEPGGSVNRGAVPREGKGIGVDQALGNGSVEESRFEEPEQESIRLVGGGGMFLVKPEKGIRGNITNGFGLFAFFLRGDHLRVGLPDVRGKIVVVGEPEACKEVVKGRGPRGVTGTETAEDGVERRGFQKAGPIRDGDDVHHDGEQKGAEHAGGLPRRCAERGITRRHEGVNEGEIQGEDPVIDRLVSFAEAGVKTPWESVKEKFFGAGLIGLMFFRDRFHKR